MRASHLTLPIYMAAHEAAIPKAARLVFPCMTALDLMPIALLMQDATKHPPRTKHDPDALRYARVMGRRVEDVETDLFRSAHNAFAKGGPLVPWSVIVKAYGESSAVVDGALGIEWPEERAA